MLTSKPRSEVGAGGEAEDLNQVHELALNDAAAVESLIELCTEGISDQEAQSRTIDLINKARGTQKMVISLDALKLDKNHETIPLSELTKLLAKLVVGTGGVSQIEGISEGASRCVGGDREKARGTCTVRQKSPRSIVSAVRVQRICTMTYLRRIFHTQGTLRMKSSALL